MVRNFALLLVSIMCLGITHGTCNSQERTNLSLEQRKQVISLITDHDSFKSQSKGKAVLCELVVRDTKLADGKVAKRATAYHFLYDSGATLRSTVDIENNKILDVVKLVGYSPPLSPEERQEALRIAIEKTPEVRALFDHGPNIPNEMMPSVVNDRNSSKFGHRIVRVAFMPSRNAVKRIEVIVDLTEKAIQGSPTIRQRPVANPTATIEYGFPLLAPPAQQETRWRVKFGTTYQGAGEILYVEEAYFKRSKNEPWVQVLGDCRLAEMFVPYNDGFTRFYDITSVGGDLIALDQSDFGPVCLGAPQLFLNDKVACEFHDAHNLWMDPFGESRRLEEMHLWAVLPTGNYAYPMMFVFRSDGSIGIQVAATAHNLMNSKDDDAVHLHIGCWRLNIALGDQALNRIETVRFESSAALGAKANTIVEPFNGSVEGGIEWNPEEFMRIRVTSKTAVNNHNPPSPISYELVPIRQGNARTYGAGEEWTHKDLWVTLPYSSGNTLQDRANELPSYVASPRSLNSVAATIWCKSALIHRPRDEDFGINGYDSWSGVALTTWTGFNLVPRNFLAETPLYP